MLHLSVIQAGKPLHSKGPKEIARQVCNASGRPQTLPPAALVLPAGCLICLCMEAASTKFEQCIGGRHPSHPDLVSGGLTCE